MKQLETEHYIFHYGSGSVAEREIEQIAATQEDCFRQICEALGVMPEFKLQYFLCETPEEVGHIYGDDDPCNGFAAPPDKIYAVYSDQIKCIGFHEDAHLLSYLINRPSCPAIREGLAMYFDKTWWGIPNEAWTAYYLKTGRYLPADRLLDREFFISYDCTLTYPIVGAFTNWLISRWGMERYLEMYRQKDMIAAMEQVYAMTPETLGREFADYIRRLPADTVPEEQMKKLLEEE